MRSKHLPDPQRPFSGDELIVVIPIICARSLDFILRVASMTSSFMAIGIVPS